MPPLRWNSPRPISRKRGPPWATLLPALEGAGLTRKFNGLFSFTNDGFPVLGESPDVRGFWSAQAVWITHAGGVGKAVAEWIVNGEPTTDLRECDITCDSIRTRTAVHMSARAPPSSTARCTTSSTRASR